MMFSARKRKNLVIFSLVSMLGLIGYVNYNLNQQSLLQTSTDLENYELTMMEESGMFDDLFEGEMVFNEDETISDNGIVEISDEQDQKNEKDEERTNAIIVDSIVDNEVTDLAKTTNAQIVKTITNKKAMKSNIYFIESRLERDKKRSEMISSLDDIINGQNTSEQVISNALDIKMSTVLNTEKEMFIESMVLAKGFDDVIVYLSDKSINVIVNSEKLDENDVAKIVDIVNRETDIAMDNIIIMNK